MAKIEPYIRLYYIIIIKTPSYLLKINKRTNIFAMTILKCAFIGVSASVF